MNDILTHKKTRLLFVGFAGILAIVYDVLSWRHELGLNFFLFVVVYVIGLTGLLLYTQRFRQPRSFLLAVVAMVMAVTPLLYQNTMVHAGVPLFVFILLFLYTAIAPLDNSLRLPFNFTAVPMIASIDRAFTEIGTVYRDLTVHPTSTGQSLRRVMIGVLSAIPILFVFGVLFYYADDVFATWVNRLSIDMTTAWRVFRTVGLIAVFSSLFYGFLVKHYGLGEKKPLEQKTDVLPVEIVLLLVNALFLIFVCIQFAYLFGGQAYLFQKGLTYAYYARKGFFELTAVMALVGLMTTIIYRYYAHVRSRLLLRVLEIVLIVQVIVIGVSAVTRMNLYQAAYGFTTIRLYSEWFIYFLILLFAWFAVCIALHFPYRRYVHAGLAIGLVALTVVVCRNVDYIIASKNVERYVVDHKKIDLQYLSTLSTDAVPALVGLYGPKQEGLSNYLTGTSLKEMVRLYLTRMEIDTNEMFDAQGSVIEFNYSVYQAKQIFFQKQ